MVFNFFDDFYLVKELRYQASQLSYFMLLISYSLFLIQ
jgi:hypothetical protein